MADDETPTTATTLADAKCPTCGGLRSFAAATEDEEDFGIETMTAKDARMLRALRAFQRCGQVVNSCKAAGISTGTWYNWRETEPDFERTFQRLRQASTEELEEIGIKRAKDGSDGLLMFFLRAGDPGKYREKQTIEVVSPDVQSRLALQAEAILSTCKELLPREQAGIVGARLAGRLREIWS